MNDSEIARLLERVLEHLYDDYTEALRLSNGGVIMTACLNCKQDLQPIIDHFKRGVNIAKNRTFYETIIRHNTRRTNSRRPGGNATSY